MTISKFMQTSASYAESPIYVVATQNSGGSGTTSSITASWPGYSAVEGDLVVVSFAVGSVGTIADMLASDASWTRAAVLFVGGTYTPTIGLFYKVMTSTPDTSLTFINGSSSTANAYAWTVHVFKNVNPVNPVLNVATNPTFNTAYPTPPQYQPKIATSVSYVVGAAGHTSGGIAFVPPTYMRSFSTRGANDTYDVSVGSGFINSGGQYINESAWVTPAIASSTSTESGSILLELNPA